MSDEIYSEHTEVSNPRPELSPQPVDKRPLIFGLLGALLIIIIFGVITFFLFRAPEATAVIRDIFIIYLGLGAFIIILLLIALIVITAYLVLKVNDLVKLLDREIKPVLSRLQDTAINVQGTTNFITENAIRPVINTASTIVAAQSVIRTLFRRD